ncbi:MAG: serine/threonine protein kinase, partial [Planctomycetales bacterium]|nr:serine/threonine protein kinase [Planctomycetales bacterium]
MSRPHFSAAGDTSTAARLTLDEVIEAFETAWELAGDADPRHYLPHRAHPERNRIGLELLCVDIERRCAAGRRRELDAYRRDFAEVLADSESLHRLAFEEYRARLSGGERIDPDEYAATLHVDTRDWPRPTTGDTDLPCRDQTNRRGVADNDDLVSAVPENAINLFPEFQASRTLGVGAFGRVYLAKQKSLAARDVVVKITKAVWSESDNLARLQHDNIVPIHSVHRAGDLQAVCMPYLGACTLAQLLSDGVSGASLSFDEFWHVRTQRDHEVRCLEIAKGLADGLEHAHSKGIVHRDLKPANILLTEDRQPLLLDFNLSANTHADRQSNWIGGTVAYMSPEHLQAACTDGEVDHLSDIYSLGVVLFEMLTGRVPFSAARNLDTIDVPLMLVERARIGCALDELQKQYSLGTVAILRRCLESEPSARYQSAAQLAEDLQQQSQYLPLRHTAVSSRIEPLRNWTRRQPRWKMFSAVAVLTVVAVSVLTVFLARSYVHSQRLAAELQVHRFEEDFIAARAALSAPWHDVTTWQDGIDLGRDLLRPFQASSPDWRTARALRWLEPTMRARVVGELQDIEDLLKRSARRQWQLSSRTTLAPL